MSPSKRFSPTKSPTRKVSRPGSMPKSVKPMLATLVEEPFDKPGWLYEIKWDGYRAIAEVNRRGVKLYSRSQNSFNQSTRRSSTRLNNSVTRLCSMARSWFWTRRVDRGSNSCKTIGRRVRAVGLYRFDLLFLDGRDLHRESLRVRRQLLSDILTDLPNVILSESVENRGVEFFRAAVKHGLEGIIAKDGESPYREAIRGR